MASTSSSTASSLMVYDVFLNHCESDAKEGLAMDICHALNRMRRRVFLNQQVLEHGDSMLEEIEAAMSNASVCVAIFSARYAEYSRCLEELSFMVQNKKKIIPIFYKVEPSDLRWVAQGKGVYVEVFSQHEKKLEYTPQKLEEWKTALYNVSCVYGPELKNKDGLLKSIVECVLKHMPSPIEVEQHLVGLDKIVEDFENTAFKFSDREQHVDIVGIVGMGGSGKTTLAKELYNRKCLKIDRHSHISEVRDAAAKNTLHIKQKQLLEDLLFKKLDKSIDNIAEGKQILRARLRCRVLIVLDDVDHVDQIDALLPEKDCIFARGSLIIVTTRESTTESDVLRSLNPSFSYRMKPLNPIHAKQLLCWHAFMRSDPVEEFEDLVKKVMDVCQGFHYPLRSWERSFMKGQRNIGCLSWIKSQEYCPTILWRY